mmetsp:Transcript_16687/g.24674  ORF Transcript_16687/g.24674 Transcript_16687/m.24674 type:complete len:87 (+) Transcript_16687:182-442(+)
MPPGTPFTLTPNGIARTKKQMKMDKDKCDHCGKMQSLLNKKLKECTRCEVIFYCGRDCQKAAWKKHKKVCKAPSAGGGLKFISSAF